MTQYTGIEFERRVAETIERLDYKVTMEPPPRAEHTSWQERISSWLMRPSYSLPMPDMLVANGEKVALVEVKTYPILLGSVIQARHYADYFGVPAIICVPDDAFPKIPVSVQEWAVANDIVLSPFGDIGDNLKILLR